MSPPSSTRDDGQDGAATASAVDDDEAIEFDVLVASWSLGASITNTVP
jgi:hypothetical protein